jgi:uncharacterized protein YraI
MTTFAKNCYRTWLMSLPLAALACAAPAVAQTAATAPAAGTPAVINASVTVRAGPARSFPAVTWLLGGTRVTLLGCLDNWRWCDVVAGRDRGWVYASYLTVSSEGRSKRVRQGGPDLGLPEVTFAVGPYWDEHFSDRPWYSRKAYWQTRWDRRPAQPAAQPSPSPAAPRTP